MRRIGELAAATGLAVALLATPAAAQQVLTFGGSDAIGSLIDQANQKFSELVNERAEGRLQVNFIQGEQLGNDIDVIQQMMQGSVDLYGDVLDWYANWVPDFNILAWGFSFRDNDHMQTFLESEIYAALAERLREEQGIRILAAAPTQPRILMADRPVETPDDLIDLKMRVPEIRTYLLLWQTLGTQPSRLAWAEIFLGLSTGTVEAAEGPVSSVYAAKLHEVAPYVIRTDHLVSTHHITMNEAAFSALEPDLQEILLTAAQEATQWARMQAEAETEQVIRQMEEEGATIIVVDREPFAAKAQTGAEELEADGVWSEGLWERIRNL